MGLWEAGRRRSSNDENVLSSKVLVRLRGGSAAVKSGNCGAWYT